MQPDFTAAIHGFIADLSETGKRELTAALFDAASRNFDAAQRYKRADMDPEGFTYHMERRQALVDAAQYVLGTLPKETV
jgi:hypothetical protein